MEREYKVWLTGAKGQLGNTILRHFGSVERIKWIPTTKENIDLTKPDEVKDFFSLSTPDVIVNAAAFTNVDDAEVKRSEAIRMNTDCPGLLAELCASTGAVLFHISTDHVFGGSGSTKAQIPFREDDIPIPANFYAKTKLKGEQHVLAKCGTAYVWRTAWLYSPYGKNFYNTIRRKAMESAPLRVVTDEIGTPTSAINLARSIVDAILMLGTQQQIPFGLYHYANLGEVSRYYFAKTILELDTNTSKAIVEKCLREDYNTLAQRPSYSALDVSKLKAHLPHFPITWQEALKEVYEAEASNR